MNAENLKRLKNYTKDTSLLYVEDSVVLQKQVSKFLGNVFDRFYQARDGKKGFDAFIAEEPDIVITDIDMPNKNGLEMIADMKNSNPDLNVIVLTAHHDNETLFKTMNLGIANFLSKPLNIDLLVETLLKDIDMISKMQKIKSMNDLSIIKNHDVPIRFFNTYKGIPIEDEGKVVALSEDTISLQVTPKQFVVIKDQGFTLIKLPESKKYIKAQVDSYDIEKKEVIVSNPRYINFKARSTSSKRLRVDNSFKVTLNIGGKKIETYPYDASYVALGLVLEQEDLEISLEDELNIDIEFKIPVYNSNGVLLSKNTYRFDSKCEILRLQSSSKGTILALKLNLNDKNTNFYENYLQMLERDLINNLKKMIVKVK